MIALADIKNELRERKRIVITTHHKPDGDAMGSSLGLYHFLCGMGHEVHVITPTDYPFFLQWLPGNADVVDFMQEPERATDLVAKAEWIFCLDFNALSRINELGELVRASSAKKAMIDHHLEPEGFDDFRYWDTTAVATAELVERFIVDLGMKQSITKDIATCLYLGIMTDSGSFRFPSTTARVHRVIAELIDAGADNAHIHQMVYDTNSENRLKFLGEVLSNCMTVLPEQRTAYMIIPQSLLQKYNIRTGDTEGMVNYALSINGIRLACLIIDRGELRKLSFRSKGDFPANEIAKKYFHGGGHRNAAGGMSTESIEQTRDKFLAVLPEFQELLII